MRSALLSYSPRLLAFAIILEICLSLFPARACAQNVYRLDEIPAQTFWRSSPIAFQVQQPGLQPPYTVSSSPKVQGKLDIDRKTGSFDFEASPGDEGNFHVTITAHSQDGSEVSKQFVISVLNGILPEFELVGRARPLPVEESVQYLSITENDDPVHKPFNTQPDQKLVNVAISGKKVIFDGNADNNGLVARFGTGRRTDIESLDVYAETVVIRSPLLFHQTSVNIYAKELRFEDQPGKEPATIVTTPLDFASIPGVHADGSQGLDGGSISVVVQSFYSSPSPAKRFVLNGGNGQAAGPGQQGPKGASLACLGGKIVNDTCVVHVHTYSGPTTFPGAFQDNFPTQNGTDSTPAGFPGDPGNGGNFSYTVDGLNQFAEAKPGNPGKKGDDVPGGPVGSPIHALWLENGNHSPGPLPPYGLPGCLALPILPCRVEHQYDFHAGNAAPAPNPKHPVGIAGLSTKVAQSDSWLSPFALRAILNHAEDAYLGGNLEYTASTLDSYQPIVQRIIASLSQGDQTTPLGDDQSNSLHEFTSLSLEMASTRTRIANNLDYFGHPAGWVPELSFDASLASYSDEIDTAIPILYLAYYVTNSSADHDRHIAGMRDSVANLVSDIGDSTAKYNSAQLAIPGLATEATNLKTDINLFQEKVEIRRADLLARAQQVVEDRHSVPFWKQALNTLSAAAQVFPIGQPVVGSVGKGLNVLSNLDQNSPIASIQQAGSLVGDFNDANIKKSVSDYHDALSKLDPGNAKNAKEYVKSIEPYGEKLALAYKAVDSSLQSHGAPKSEVDAELSQLEASDPDFTDLVSNLKDLNAKEITFVQKLDDATKETSKLEATITSDWQGVDSINREISSATSKNDHEAVQQIAGFARRTRDRLLEYQYYMAKAYEYRMLEPYDGDFNLNNLMTRISQLLESSSTPHTEDYQRLSSEDFKTLKSIYKESVQEVIFKAFQKFQNNPPTQHLTFPYSLTASELDQLNTRGSLTLDMSRAVPPFDYEENRRINTIDVANIQAVNADGSVAQQAIRITFDHWGTSTFRNKGHSYVFEHRRSALDRPFEWGGLYDPTSPNNWSRQSDSPNYLATLQTLFSLSDQQKSVTNLFAHPGLDSNVTITRQRGDGEKITNLNIKVDYDFDRGTVLEYPLTVSASIGDPLIEVSPADDSGRSLGQGIFTRRYIPGTQVTITAPKNLGKLHFKAWHDGLNVTNNATLNVTMDKAKIMTVEYEDN